MSDTRRLREIVVFLPFDEVSPLVPLDAAHALIAALGIEHAAVGSDVLTGSVEMRMPYDAGIVAASRKALNDLGVLFEIEVR